MASRIAARQPARAQPGEVQPKPRAGQSGAVVRVLPGVAGAPPATLPTWACRSRPDQVWQVHRTTPPTTACPTPLRSTLRTSTVSAAPSSHSPRRTPPTHHLLRARLPPLPHTSAAAPLTPPAQPRLTLSLARSRLCEASGLTLRRCARAALQCTSVALRQIALLAALRRGTSDWRGRLSRPRRHRARVLHLGQARRMCAWRRAVGACHACADRAPRCDTEVSSATPRAACRPATREPIFAGQWAAHIGARTRPLPRVRPPSEQR